MKDTGALCFYQPLLKLGKCHFCIMSERTLCYRTGNVWAKCYKSQKWEREAQSAEMHVCVGWCVKWNSLWCYTTLPSYSFIEWMISMIVTVRLWSHSKYCQTGSMYAFLIFNWLNITIMFANVSLLVYVNFGILTPLEISLEWERKMQIRKMKNDSLLSYFFCYE